MLDELVAILPQPQLPVVLADDVFLHFETWWLQLEDFLSGPGFCKGFGIVEGELDLQGVLIHAAEPFCQVQILAMRGSQRINPGLVADGRCIHEEVVITNVSPSQWPIEYPIHTLG